LRGTVTARVFVFIFGEILFETVVEIARVSQRVAASPVRV